MKTNAKLAVHQKPSTLQQLIKTWIGMGAVLGFGFLYIFSLPEIQVNRLEVELGTLYYEIYVQDENNRFNEESIKLMIISDTEFIEIDLVRGQNQGDVNVLPDTHYEITLVGSVGFGVKTWETYTIENNHILLGEGE